MPMAILPCKRVEYSKAKYDSASGSTHYRTHPGGREPLVASRPGPLRWLRDVIDPSLSLLARLLLLRAGVRILGKGSQRGRGAATYACPTFVATRLKTNTCIPNERAHACTCRWPSGHFERQEASAASAGGLASPWRRPAQTWAGSRSTQTWAA